MNYKVTRIRCLNSLIDNDSRIHNSLIKFETWEWMTQNSKLRILRHANILDHRRYRLFNLGTGRLWTQKINLEKLLK